MESLDPETITKVLVVIFATGAIGTILIDEWPFRRSQRNAKRQPRRWE